MLMYKIHILNSSYNVPITKIGYGKEEYCCEKMIDFLQRWEMNSCTEKGSKKTAWYLKDWHIHLALPDYHGYE